VSASPPAADLSKLRINHDDPPPAVKRALGRVLWLTAAAVLIFLVVFLVARRGALPLNGIVTSTTNWSSFSEIAFSFRVTPLLLALGLIFAVVTGVVGGFFPALRAARLQVVQALR